MHGILPAASQQIGQLNYHGLDGKKGVYSYKEDRNKNKDSR